MRGKSKILTGIAIICVMISSISIVAYAGDNEVNKTQDNITVTKTANWAEYNGKTTDSNGNPYIKIDFKVDTTKAAIITVPVGGDADIVLVVDNTASYESRFPKAKAAASQFVESVMSITSHKVRVGVVEFGNQSYIKQEISDDKTKVKSVVDNLQIDPVRNGTNMHYGVYNAQKMLEKSTAKTKVMIILSDGEPNRIIGKDVHNVANGKSYTINQLQEADKAIKGLKVVTLGYCTNTSASDFLKSLASKDSSGKEMFYTASDSVNDITKNISSVFETISKEVSVLVYGNSLVDNIPAECNIVNGTFKVNDEKMKASLTNNDKTVVFDWGDNKLEQKVYEASLLMTLDKTKLNDKQLSGEEMINTNGSTIDTKVDSTGSSSFAYGEQGIIKLTSPKLSLKDVENTVKVGKEQYNSTEGKDSTNKLEVDNTPKTGDTFNNIIYIGIIVSGMVVLATGICRFRKNRY